MSKIGSLLAGAALVLAGQPVAAKPPIESFCSLIRKTEDGKFRHERLFGWSLFAAQSEPGEITYDSDVVGVTCLRAPLNLVAEDAETLRQGITIYLADPESGTTVKYERKEGQIVHQVTIGTVRPRDLERLANSAAEIAARL